MSDSMRLKEVFFLAEYENPKIKDFIAQHKEQHDKDIVAETVSFLIGAFPEIAPTLKGDLVSVREEELNGNYGGR